MKNIVELFFELQLFTNEGDLHMNYLPERLREEIIHADWTKLFDQEVKEAE